LDADFLQGSGAGIRYNGRTSVNEIETAIARLPLRDITKLLFWLAAHHTALWDKQIEYDLDTGKLDTLLAEVGAEYAVGVAMPLWRMACISVRRNAA